MGATGTLSSAHIHILVDNSTLFIDGRLAEYGFSALIEARSEDGNDYLILFDTGQTGKPLLHNLDLLGVKPTEIDYLVLSHRHSDHTGGVRAFLEARRKHIPVVAHPDIFAPSYAIVHGVLYEIGFPLTPEALASLGGRLVKSRRPLEIVPGVYFSGEVPSKWGPRHTALVYREEGGVLVEDPVPDDAFLALRLRSGTYVVTGCGHAGIENILSYAREVTGARIAGVVGGLHLLGATAERLAAVAKLLADMHLGLVAALHCTGPFAQYVLREKLGEAYRYAATGTRLDLA